MIFFKKMWIVIIIRFAGGPLVQEKIHPTLYLMLQVSGSSHPSFPYFLLIYPQ